MQERADHGQGVRRSLRRSAHRGQARHRHRFDGEVSALGPAGKSDRPLPAIVRRLWLYGRISDLAHVPGRPRVSHLCRHQRDHEAVDLAHPVERAAPTAPTGGPPKVRILEEFMTDAFVYDHVRTPRGKGKADGSLHEVTALKLASSALTAVKERNELDP